MDTLYLIPLACFNVLIALLLYIALSGDIGRLRKDMRRFARQQRSDRRRPRSVRDSEALRGEPVVAAGAELPGLRRTGGGADTAAGRCCGPVRGTRTRCPGTLPDSITRAATTRFRPVWRRLTAGDLTGRRTTTR